MTAMTMTRDGFSSYGYSPDASTYRVEEAMRRPDKAQWVTSTATASDVDAAAKTSEKAPGLAPFVEREARRLFDVARRTERSVGFEIGMENPFRDEVHAFLQRNGSDAIEAIKRLLPLQSPAAQAATIVYLGDADVPQLLADRLALVVLCLQSEYPAVRDAAGVALIDLDDERAVPLLTAAIDNESLRSLKRHLEQARSYLKRRR